VCTHLHLISNRSCSSPNSSQVYGIKVSTVLLAHLPPQLPMMYGRLAGDVHTVSGWLLQLLVMKMNYYVCLCACCIAVLRCAVLCCAVLCCAVLCCAVLCCAVQVGPAKITAAAWASTAGTPSMTGLAGLAVLNAATAVPELATATATDALLVSTACGCLVRVTVQFSSSRDPRPVSHGSVHQPTSSCSESTCSISISITAVDKVFGAPATCATDSCGVLLGPLLLSLPQQRLLLVADEQSSVLLLQMAQSDGSDGSRVAAAGAAAAVRNGPAGAVIAGSTVDTPTVDQGGATQQTAVQAELTTAHAAAAAAAAAAAEGMDVDAAASAGDAAVHTRPASKGHRTSQKLEHLSHLLAALKPAAAPPDRGSPTLLQPSSSQTQARQQNTSTTADCMNAYGITDSAQLLGQVGPCLAVPHTPSHPHHHHHHHQQQQHPWQPGSSGPPGAAAAAAGGGGVSDDQDTPATALQQPLLVAARAGHEGGLRVLSPATQVTQVISGPEDMLAGASSMWALTDTPDSSEHVALLFSFAAGASRALSVGVAFRDVTDLLGLQAQASTLFAACVAEGVVAQVTPTGVYLCCMDSLLSCSSDNEGRAWRGSPKSSRSTGAWQQQQGLPSADAAAAANGSSRGTSSSGSGSMSPQMRPHAAAGTGCPQSSRLAVSSSDAAVVGCLGGDVAMAGCREPLDGQAGMAAGEHPARRWCLQEASIEDSSSSSIVLAAGAAGVVVVYTSTGRLVVLSVHGRQQQQQQHTLAPLVLDSAASPAAATGPGSSSSKKRGRCSWGVSEACSMQLTGQVSCLQVCATTSAAAAAAAAAGPDSSSSSGSHIIILGRYDGSLQLLTAHPASGCIQNLARFDQQHLLPLQHLARTLHSSSGAVGAGTVSSGRHNALQPTATAATVPVPDCCVVLAPGQSRCAATGATGAASGLPAGAAGVFGGLKRTKPLPSSPAASGLAAEASGCLHFCVSYRTGDVAAYRLDLTALLRQQQQQLPPQQQQRQQQQSCLVDTGCAAAQVHLRVLSQLRLPHMIRLQVMPPSGEQQQQEDEVLAVGSSTWRLCLDRSRQQMTSSLISPGPVMLASVVSLPQVAHTALQASSNQQQQRQEWQRKSRLQQQAPPQEQQQQALQEHRPWQQIASGAATQGEAQGVQAQQPALSASAQQPHQLQQQQQQPQQPQQQQQHIAVVTAAGQLQLLSLKLQQQQQQLSELQATTWLPHTTVTHLLQHTSSNLLLAACSGYARPGSSKGLVGQGSEGSDGEECSWLQVLEPLTGAPVAAFQPSRGMSGQWISCMALWDAPWKAQGSGGHGAVARVGAQDTAAAAGQGLVGAGQAAAAAAEAGGGGGGGARGGLARPGAGRWWQRLRQRRLNPVGAAAGDQLLQTQQQTAAQQQHQQRGGRGRARRGAAAAATDGSSSGSEHFFQLGSLLRGLDSPVSGGGGGGSSSKAHSSGRSSQAARAVKQRVGPLIVLGTEAFGQLDGCYGQVLVLQLVHSSRGQQQQQQQCSQEEMLGGSASSSSRAVRAEVSRVVGSSKQASPESQGASGTPAGTPGVTTTTAASSSNGSSSCWSVQRVGRLRMPEVVSAVAAFSSELLLVATRQVLALYQLQQQDRLIKVAYCFTRAPIVSLSPAAGAGITTSAAAGSRSSSSSSSSSSLGLVLAADSLQGVAVYQVRCCQACVVGCGGHGCTCVAHDARSAAGCDTGLLNPNPKPKLPNPNAAGVKVLLAVGAVEVMGAAGLILCTLPACGCYSRLMLVYGLASRWLTNIPTSLQAEVENYTCKSAKAKHQDQLF